MAGITFPRSIIPFPAPSPKTNKTKIDKLQRNRFLKMGRRGADQRVWLDSRSSRMEVIPDPVLLPPAIYEWLGGGIVAELIVEAVAPAAVEDVFWLLSRAGLMPPSPFAACGFGVSADISLCNGEECTGDADFLLCESPVLPRDEFRGETLPVWSAVSHIKVTRELRLQWYSYLLSPAQAAAVAEVSLPTRTPSPLWCVPRVAVGTIPTDVAHSLSPLSLLFIRQQAA